MSSTKKRRTGLARSVKDNNKPLTITMMDGKTLVYTGLPRVPLVKAFVGGQLGFSQFHLRLFANASEEEHELGFTDDIKHATLFCRVEIPDYEQAADVLKRKLAELKTSSIVGDAECSHEEWQARRELDKRFTNELLDAIVAVLYRHQHGTRDAMSDSNQLNDSLAKVASQWAGSLIAAGQFYDPLYQADIAQED